MLNMNAAGNQGAGTTAATMSGTNPDGMEVLGEFGWVPDGSGATYWFAWYFQYLATSIAYNSYTATHLPGVSTSNHAQHTRWDVD